MRPGPRDFRPGWVPTLATLLLLPCLIALGFWQLDRAGQKRASQTAYEAGVARAPESLTGVVVAVPGDLRYRRLRVSGEFETRWQFLLDNRVHAGRAGYHVLTPFRISGSETRLLINRGWVPVGNDRSVLPDVPAPIGPVMLIGTAIVPSADYYTLESRETAETWNPVWQNLDLRRYQARVPFPIQPAVLQLDAGEPGGFVCVWPRPGFGVEKNQGYALQWFMMAAALTIAYLVVNLKRVNPLP